MTVSHRATNATWDNGATGLTADEVVGIPAAQLTGDMILIIACWKDFAITASVAGYSELIVNADGAVAAGNGSGSMNIGVWYKEATSDAESDPTVDFSTTVNLVGEATCMVFSKSEASWNTPLATFGPWPSSAGPATRSASVALDIPSGGAVIGIAAIRDDSATFTRPTTAIAQASVTWNGNYVEAPATHASTTTGNDMSCDAGYRLVTTGAAGVAPTMTIDALTAAETGNLVWVVLGDGAAAAESAQFHTSYRSIYTGPTTD